MQVVGYILYTFLCLVGIFIIFGLVIELTRRITLKLIPYKMFQCTCFLGTPVHEIGHAAMCLIFGHKINDIKLLQFNSEDGCMGYVEHTYNPKNIYHRIGNFFIGIGPIIFGSLVLLLLLWLLLPNTFSSYFNALNANVDELSFSSVFKVIKNGSIVLFKSLISSYNKVGLYIFILLGWQISSHMSLSIEDMKGALDGLVFITIIITVVTLVMYYIFKPFFNTYLKYVGIIGCYAFMFLLISLIFCIISLILGLIVKLVTSIRR